MLFDISGPNDCDCLCATGTGTFPETPGCSSCDDPPLCWWVEVKDVVGFPANDPPCSACPTFPREVSPSKNGLFNVDLVFPCLWKRTYPIPTESPISPLERCFGKNTSIEFTVVNTSIPSVSFCRWTVSIVLNFSTGHPSQLLVQYEIDDCTYNCDGPLTLNKKVPFPQFPNFICDWPDTIRLIPNRTCLGTDTGTGTPSPPGPEAPCNLLICLYEFQSPGQWELIGNNCNLSTTGPCGCNVAPVSSIQDEFGDQITIPCGTLP